MTPSSTLDVTRFSSLVAERLGLALDDSRQEALAQLLETRAKARQLGVSAYLDELGQRQRGAAEFAAMASELTVGETYFFRHADQLRAFTHAALERWQTQEGAQRPFRVLSAGCATGEEPYSLAILACEHGVPKNAPLEILGVDLNRRSIERAERAHYSPWALRETTEAQRDRHFRKVGAEFALNREPLVTVRFRQENLVESDLFGYEAFDVVFCRNVLMYFTREQAAMTVRRFSTALRPGGHLFLGHAENLRGLSHDFHLRNTDGAFYYERKGTLEGRVHAISVPVHAHTVPSPDSGIGQIDLGSWLDSVERSSQRIRALSDQAASAPAAASPAFTPADDSRSLRTILSLVESERFDEALETIALLDEVRLDADLLLVRAALLTHSGRIAPAERACQLLLEADELNAPAHYLLALLEERRGMPGLAMEHDRTASYLDPTFAMPHLHLGIVAARSGDTATARASLSQAVGLLEQEDPLRLLLFGGGFRRSSLIQMCHAELSRLGGPS